MGDNQEMFEFRLERMEKTLESIDEKVSNLNLVEHRIKGLEKRMSILETKAEKKIELIFGAIVSAGIGGVITYLVTILLKK